MPISIDLVRKMEILDPGMRDILYSFMQEIEKSREEAVSKVEFNELKSIVQDLAVNLGELSMAQKELTKAQERTECKVNELAEAQKETQKELKELAKAQERTEKRFDSLETVMKGLIEAQKETQEELKKLTISHLELAKEHKETRKQLGGLSRDVGFNLENQAYIFLPELLKQDYGFTVQDDLIRDYLKGKKGENIEVNILGKACKEGKNYLIIGECKCHLSNNDINHFIKSRLKKFEGLYPEKIFPLIITHMVVSPEVREYASSMGIKIYYSYQFKGG